MPIQTNERKGQGDWLSLLIRVLRRDASTTS